MQNPKALIIIPSYNEAENLPKILDELSRLDHSDVLVIDDCSNDNTPDVLKKYNVNYVRNIFNMGYARSVQTGIKYAYSNGYDFAIQMDADGQHAVSDAKKLYQHIKDDDCDIVIGSRYLKKTNYKCPAFRRFGTKIFERLIKLFCHKKIADPLSGFQCFNRKVMREYIQPDFYPEYPDANLIMEMLYRGYKIHEISVEMKSRESGESMHGGFIKPAKYMVGMLYSIGLIVLQNLRRKVKVDE